ncbi:FG-GAP repeat domain-containing protein [Ekhidna sp. To15]|uniref:FG-GAP repeat domain-containing protein n=1 Tax=Ekhidna sp. To15 TaxID=3395267 RepID=UPI003F523245
MKTYHIYSLRNYAFKICFIAMFGILATSCNQNQSKPVDDSEQQNLKLTELTVVSNQWGSAGYTWPGDYDGNGMTDIASAISGTIYVYLSTGDDFEMNAWTVPNQWGSSDYSWTGDFNGDGKTDIASANAGDIYMHLSTGLNFSSDTWTVPNQWGGSGYSWVGDFNGDGKTDIASANSGDIYVHLSTGTGFTNDTWTVPNQWGSSDYTWVGDFNGDGKTDIASANAGDIYVHLSTGSGFNSSTWTVHGSWGSSGYTWASDFNADGKTDIASANGGNIYMNLSTGSSFTSETWVVPASWGSSDYTWAVDFNADGASGIASANAGNVYMNLSTGTGFSSETWSVAGNWGSASYTWPGDFNGDGYNDILSADGNQMFLYLSRGGRFASEIWYSAQGNSSGSQLAGEESSENLFTDEVGKTVNLSRCKDEYPVPQWAVDFDKRRSLSYSMTLDDLGFVRKLSSGSTITTADDGLYIYVFHLNKKGGTRYVHLRIRRSDRPDDVGFSVQGDKKYSYDGNIPCPNSSPPCYLARGEKSETPHQFVRHTQLNQGTSPVLAAGQLQIRGGKIIWINNASGHFAPGMACLDCLEQYIDEINLPRTSYQFKRDRVWTDWIEPHDEL